MKVEYNDKNKYIENIEVGDLIRTSTDKSFLVIHNVDGIDYRLLDLDINTPTCYDDDLESLIEENAPDIKEIVKGARVKVVVE